ncbi:hypothetical protein [Sediminimonas qiaohouensis]|uniref:hypothetical protein n=1 Tax=Sediminimonas qiaohouensis TaxID=552061 RepID=UPI0003FDA279|nr:hypothetical protein [Sediminimonas qiaohouensis]
MSGAFRFHLPASVLPSGKSIMLRKRKPQAPRDMIPIGVDAISITDNNGTRSIYSYQDHEDNRCVTLTRKEADLIALANPGKRPPLVLEKIQPWLPMQKYRDNSIKNFNSLKYILKRYKKHIEKPGSFCDQKWKTICNSIRFKTEHDARFYLAWHLPIQDAYALEESRSNRRVIALDYNSMYPSCMQYDFPQPSTLDYVSLNRNFSEGESLRFGLYRCVLHPPISEFIRKYNPFRSFFAGRYLGAALNEPIFVDLNEFEIQYFHRHFARIEMIDGIVSEQRISHPLAREVQRSYARRRHYLTQGNKALADREKFLMTLLASTAHRPRVSRQTFTSREFAGEYLRRNFGVFLEEASPLCMSTRWMGGQKGITVSVSSESSIVNSPELFDGSTCFEFNQRIVARSRIVLLEMMERLAKEDPSVEICYANIDSIHASVPEEKCDAILATLRSESTDKLGSFKIEEVTRFGLWLEPGRYWLYSETVERFRNGSIGIKRGPFADHSISVLIKKLNDLFIPIRMNVRMDCSMSDTRTVIGDAHSGFVRQRLVEVGSQSNLATILERLERGRNDSIPRRMRKFRELQARIADCGDALPRVPAN